MIPYASVLIAMPGPGYMYYCVSHGSDRRFSTRSAFFLVCGYTLMRQSTVSSQNFAHFLREARLLDVSPRHEFNVLLFSGSRLFGDCHAGGAQEHLVCLGDDVAMLPCAVLSGYLGSTLDTRTCDNLRWHLVMIGSTLDTF